MMILKRFSVKIVIVILLSSISTVFAFNGTLQSGDMNNNVLCVQVLPANLGCSVGTADGIYGGNTVSAVSSFQEDSGPAVTGIVDQTT